VTDYGQELRFGLFPSPDAADVERILQLSGIAVRTFREEVAPLVRDLVDAERARAAAAPGPDEAERSSLATAEEAQPDRKGATTAYAQQQSQPLQPSPRAVTELTVRPTPDDGTRLSDQAAWDESTRRELLHPLALTGFQ